MSQDNCRPSAPIASFPVDAHGYLTRLFSASVLLGIRHVCDGAGPNTDASRHYTQPQGLRGEAFDEMYLLGVLHQDDLGRTLNDEIRSVFSKELTAWSRSRVGDVDARSQLVQRVPCGEQKEVLAIGTLKATKSAPGRCPACQGVKRWSVY